MGREKNALESVHWETAHVRHGIPAHAVDFTRYPLPFKPYDPAEVVSLEPPGDLKATGSPSLLAHLSSLLLLSYGVTAVRETGGIPFPFRTVPSAGGLYPCHLYLGLFLKDKNETCLYYYDPARHGLIPLRQARDGKLPDLSAADSSATSLYVVITAWLYNSAWKYRDRALRYVMLDAGHLVENLVMAWDGSAPSVSFRFNDTEVADMLGLDQDREAPLALVTMNWDKSVSELGHIMCHDTVPAFPQTRVRAAEASYMQNLSLPEKIRATGDARPGGAEAVKGKRGVWKEGPLETLMMPWDLSGNPEVPGGKILPDLMIQRRSRRNFVPQRIRRGEQQGLMAWLLKGAEGWQTWITLAMACRNWEGLPDGLYAVDPEQRHLNLMTAGNLNPQLAEVCLGQAWVGMAGAVFLCLANLEALEQAGGMRSYRYAMLAAGRAGQGIYLGAEALGMGCCGIGAIYDEEARMLLELNRSSALLYALAAGPVKKKIV